MSPMLGVCHTVVGWELTTGRQKWTTVNARTVEHIPVVPAEVPLSRFVGGKISGKSSGGTNGASKFMRSYRLTVN